MFTSTTQTIRVTHARGPSWSVYQDVYPEKTCSSLCNLIYRRFNPKGYLRKTRVNLWNIHIILKGTCSYNFLLPGLADWQVDQSFSMYALEHYRNAVPAWVTLISNTGVWYIHCSKYLREHSFRDCVNTRGVEQYCTPDQEYAKPAPRLC